MKKVEEPERYGRPAGHAVEDGVLQYVSPSQVKTFDTVTGGCNRAWWYDKVKHFAKRTFKSQDVGKTSHANIEHYLTTGENVLGPITIVGIEYLPAPKSRLKIEWPVYFIRPEQPLPGLGVKTPPVIPPETLKELEAQPRLAVPGLGNGDADIPVIGFIDLIDLNDLPRGRVVVIDHKTTSSIARYAKTAKDLEKDPQATAYLKWASEKWPNLPVYEFRHYYYQTHGGRRFEAVGTIFNPQQLAAAWSRFCTTVHLMEEAAGLENPTDVPANDEACGAYGGCSFAAMCPDSPGRRLHMSMLDRVKQLNAASTAAAATSAPTTPNAAAPAAGAPTGVLVKHGVTGQQYVLSAGSNDPLTFEAYTLNFAILVDRVGHLVRLPAETVVLPYVAAAGAPAPAQAAVAPVVAPVVAPPAPVAPPTAPTAPTAPTTTTTTTVAPSGAKLVITDVVEGVVPPDAAVAEPPAGSPGAPPAKRTRKPKESKAATTDAPPPAATTATPAAQVAQTYAAPPPVMPGASSAAPVQPVEHLPPPVIAPGALRLYINCVPNTPYTDLTGYVQKIAKELAVAGAIEDIRISDSGPYAYNKWTGYMAAQALANPPAGDCVIWKHDLAEPVINALSGVAVQVIRGR
jgi:hypothetical protein